MEENQNSGNLTAQPAVQENNPQTPHHTVRACYDYLEIFAYSVFAILVIFSFVFRLCRVKGDSMNQTLYDGQMLVVSDINYTPTPGDIIVFHQTGELLNEPVVKRVIATAGQTVNIDFTAGIVYVDGVAITEDYVYLQYGHYRIHADYAMPVTVPEGCLFVMGDNRNNSTDSRSRYISFVDERRVIGKVLFRVTPLSQFGSVYSATEAGEEVTTNAQ